MVEQRAAGRCEYCRMHQSLQGATFHVEHIIPRSRGGTSELQNLAWACPGCNLHKSNRVEVSAEPSGAVVRLFHPRRDVWDEHFCWQGLQIIGLTSTGQATIETLLFNNPRRIKIREAESLFKLFPPGHDEQPGQYASI